MEIKALDDFTIEKNFKVSLKEMNHIKEICYCQKRNGKITIQLLDKDTYVNLETGEVKECNHIENRSESKLQVSQSLKRLRDYINYNLVDTKKCKWICLTYAENMTDTKRLYLDFDKFIKKLRYHYGHFEYIVAMEPQGRGAWHAHCSNGGAVALHIHKNAVCNAELRLSARSAGGHAVGACSRRAGGRPLCGQSG